MSANMENSLVSAFTEDEAERLTGVSVRQLRHWDRTKFFVPSLANENRSLPFARLYSFGDLVSLKVLGVLRNDAHVSMQHLRIVKQKLGDLGKSWSSTTLYVLNKKVVFFNSATQSREEIVSGQGVLQIPLEVVTGSMRERVREWRKRDETLTGKIEKRRGMNTVVAGTRVPIANIKAFSEAGYTIDQILREYPFLTASDVKAAVMFEEAA